MRKIICLIILLLILNIVNAQDLNDYKDIEVKSTFNSKLTLNYKDKNYKIDYVNANLTFFPLKTEFQDSFYELISNPEAKIESGNNFILYKWGNLNEKELSYGLNSKVKSSVNFKKIKSKINFPLEDIPELRSYVSESQTITSKDPNIKRKAVELAERENDLFVIVNKIAVWTKENINYSLETLTAEVSQDSSWVLENKKGVCDELTSLFVAMLRSLNIPAKIIFGQAYTNVINEFGNHAWAEVYFPGYGWVAFDPTYGQMGYVDSTHIKMKEGIDVKEPSVDYGWRSFGVDIDAERLDVQSKLIKKGDLYKEDINLKINLLKDEVGPGSYVPINVEIQNQNDYYLPITIYITKAPEELDNIIRHILLKPKENKKEFFIIKVPDDLKNGFFYTSKIEIKDNFNNSDSIDLKFSDENELYTLNEAQNVINQLKEEDEKVYSSNVRVICNKDKSFYYSYEQAKIDCKVKNSGNTNLNDLDLCYSDKCDKIDLDINEEKDFSFDLDLRDYKKEFGIKVSNNEVSKNLFVDLGLIKDSNISVINLNYEKEVEYNKNYKIKFALSSESKIKDLKIKLGEDGIFDLKSFKGTQDF